MLHSVEAHRQRVRSVAFSNDGKRIVTCGEDGAARLWHAETAQPVLEIRVGTRLDKVRFADRDRQLVVLLHDLQILVYSVSPPSDADESREILSVEAELIGLGLTPAGDDFPPMAISVDGQVVVGHALMDDKSTPFRWTEAEGMRPLPVPDAYPHAYAMSADADGRMVAGRFVTPDRVTLLGRWDGDEPPPVIQPLPEGWRQILVQGMRGSSIAGYGFKQDNRQRCAFVFDGRRFCELPAFGERKNAAALTVCGEEGLVIGTAWSRNGPSQSRATGDLRVVRWLDGSGELLPGFGPEAYNWRATAASADGTVVVGHRWPVGTTPLDGAGLAFRWENGIAETLGELFGGGIQSVAQAVSADGRWVVGSSWTESGPTAFVWDRQHGMRRLEEVLRQQGADLRGWHLEYALAISADGTHIAGHGRNPADAPEIFLARISVD
jgi:uncharacterized membrane protein